MREQHKIDTKPTKFSRQVLVTEGLKEGSHQQALKETMEDIKIIPISDLLRLRRPICATASLSPHRIVTPQPPFADTKSPNPNPITSLTVLKSLPEPSMVVGTLSLLSSNQPPPPHPFFSFSDDSGSICCDVIDFDFYMIGKKIQVLSWNYVPLEKCGGLLEIIRWRFFDDFDRASVDSFSLVLNGAGECCDSKAKYSVGGIVYSVSPILIAPCSMDKTVGDAQNVRGFMVEIVNCDHLGERKERDRHDFVYFSETFSSWHPAFLRLVKRVISLSRLKKKLVYIGKEEGRLMYVTNEVTRLSFPSLKEKELSCRKRKRGGEETQELGMYIGVVRGVYMQGMAIELDEEVWLLMTDESLVLTCSVRVGAILHVRNVHIASPKFRWGKMLVLGACSKTNITTISFSPWETGCHMVSQSRSLLRKFIDSLAFPAKLWVLLVVQCFRKKFSGFFSEKEILGTKHKEGLVQNYAKSVLSSPVFQLRQGLFMEFCKHDSCCIGSNVSYGNLSLPVPLSSFLGNCDRMWLSSLLKSKNGHDILENWSQADHPFRENKLPEHTIRRFLPSKDVGISLVGNLKLSEDTGRLQFIDATGCIDAVILDLPSDWNMNVICEVVDYTLVVEGRPGPWGQTWVLEDDLFSCKSIFCPLLSERQTELIVYVYFQWSNVRHEHFPIHHYPSSTDSSAELDPGIFHLLYLVHKFPLQPQFHGDFTISDSCRLFAEVIVLPWDLNVVPIDDAAHPENLLKGEVENCSHNGFALKRCKTHHASSCTDKTEWCSNFENTSCSNSRNLHFLSRETRNFYNLCCASSTQIPCTTFVRGFHCQSVAVAGALCYTQGAGSRSTSFHPKSLRKLLLEFNSKTMLKYKLMHVGVCYIMKHLAEKCFCNSHDKYVGDKVAINMDTRLFSTAFHFIEAGSSSGSCNDPSPGSCFYCESSSKCFLQNGLVFHPGCAVHGSFCNVSLHIATDVMDHLDIGVQALKEVVTGLSVSSTSSTHGLQVGHVNTVAGNLKNQVVCFGNSLPEGSLMSLRGIVMSLHSGDGTLDDIRLSKNWKGPICLLILTDDQTLQIGGCLSKHNYPVGLAPGADVTFHRILALSGQNRLILTPVSFITVHIVKEALTNLYSRFSVREESIPSCLLSDLIQSVTSKPKRLRCRFVGVYFVILERDKNLEKLLSCIRSGTSIVNIPLAGFVMDDGSSRCICWANGERAETFLRLHEKSPQGDYGNSWWKLKNSVIAKSCSTTIFHLNKILKQHGRVTIKNVGSLHDTSSQDLHVSNRADCIFGIQDLNLLKLIAFNACSSTFWSITGHVMDSNCVSVLEKYLMKEQMTLHALQNVWARDVSPVSTLTETRALFQELKPGNILGESGY
ncbi:hypothetical protein RND81_01G093800 [Saponaria officinalis]|uniref:CST complex subunit CTC1 n=1 Tax=Saponaria officinalis TaxID=3572 RepID=A0AAW1N6I1_SAPOF